MIDSMDPLTAFPSLSCPKTLSLIPSTSIQPQTLCSADLLPVRSPDCSQHSPASKQTSLSGGAYSILTVLSGWSIFNV